MCAGCGNLQDEDYFEKSSFYKKRERVFSSIEKIELKTMIKMKEKGRKKPSRKLRWIK